MTTWVCMSRYVCGSITCALREEGVGARAMDTHNFSMGPLPDYMEREFGALGSLSHKSVHCAKIDERY